MNDDCLVAKYKEAVYELEKKGMTVEERIEAEKKVALTCLRIGRMSGEHEWFAIGAGYLSFAGDNAYENYAFGESLKCHRMAEREFNRAGRKTSLEESEFLIEYMHKAIDECLCCEEIEKELRIYRN